MSRKSNLVPTSVKKFDSSKQLCRNDITVYSSFLVVSFKWTKTLQFGNQILNIPLVLISNSKFCPVHAYRRMCELNPLPAKFPAFSVYSKKAVVLITYNQFQQKLRTLIRKVGLNPKLFSSHSFRRGGATLAAKSGVSPQFIQLMGDWKSDAYKQYIVHPLSDKLHVAKRMRNFVVKYS